MPDCLKLLLDQKEFLQARLGPLLAAAGSDAEREALRTAYEQARANWNNAVDKALAPGNATADDLVAQLQAAQRDIEESSNNMADVADTIGKITTGVNIATELVGFLL